MNNRLTFPTAGAIITVSYTHLHDGVGNVVAVNGQRHSLADIGVGERLLLIVQGDVVGCLLYTSGFPVIEYSANDAGYHIPVAEYVQQAWGELGITVNINKRCV